MRSGGGGWGGGEERKGEVTILVSDGSLILDSPFASLSLSSMRHTCIRAINYHALFKLAQVSDICNYSRHWNCLLTSIFPFLATTLIFILFSTFPSCHIYKL